ncbi:C-type lectin domain family 17, member A-like [Onychostoma macrolepis]|uniref:C-type lectin domain family 17, member A-like n=1 Tax=Onychostoma macrolepis TaxID=369639 RepID=UPI00272A384E|nr:C-type lectin domain family 17, member A-like [Onychostoma macrolepis]
MSTIVSGTTTNSVSDDIYDNAFGTETEGMEMTVDIYESVDHVRDHDFRTETKIHQPLQRTGSDSERIRSSRAAVVCFVLLCVLLLTAVIMLCVYIHTNNTNYTNYTQETNQLLTNITNLTEERDNLRTNITNLTEERDNLRTNITNLTEERDNLRTNITNLTEERDKHANLLNKRDQLINQLPILGKDDGWIYYQFSFYYMSNETKNWNDSRQDCKKRRADLIIINNREEQDFVMKITDKREFWIGVTDVDEEGRWRWVDGSTMTSGFWASSGEIKEPKGGRLENCAVTYLKKIPGVLGWHDVKCNDAYQWICEKSILPLIQS